MNGKLKIDLGAPHRRLQGTATIGDSGDGLVVGNVYELSVFHAERHPRESNFELTLPAFSRSISDCEPACGDGVVTGGEA